MESDQSASRHAVKDRPGVEFSREAGNIVRLHFPARRPTIMRGNAPYHEAAISEEQPHPRKH